MKRDTHKLAGQTVKIKVAGNDDNAITQELDGQDYVVEDWWENVSGGSWMNAAGNPACIKYAMRSGFAGLPTDNEVVYGKVGAFGHLVHVSELVSPA